jgi:hypothetical protein
MNTIDRVFYFYYKDILIGKNVIPQLIQQVVNKFCEFLFAFLCKIGEQEGRTDPSWSGGK